MEEHVILFISYLYHALFEARLVAIDARCRAVMLWASGAAVETAIGLTGR